MKTRISRTLSGVVAKRMIGPLNLALASALFVFAFPTSLRAQSSPLVYVYGRADFPAGNATMATTGDFDGDGRLDFVAVSYEQNSVSVLFGQPDGSFAETGVVYAVGVQPTDAAVGDFNGDGKLDLAVLNQVCITDPCPPGTVSILLGNGDGTFQPPIDYQTAPNPVGVLVGDFNGDGIPDIAAAAAVSRISSGANGVVSVLIGNGDGTFQAHADSAAGTGVIGLVAADFNGDTTLDLVVDNHPSPGSQTVSLLLGMGDGTFAPPTAVPVGADPTSLTTGDFDGDGKPDVAVTTGPGRIAVLMGNGDGTFRPHVDYPCGFGPSRITAADLNRDGKLDLVVSVSTGLPSNGSISVLLGVGDGTFQPFVEYGTGTFGRVAVGDFNGDGNPDVAVAKGGSTVSVLLGNGDGTLPRPIDYATNNGPTALAAGDFNGDGKLDLAIVNSPSETVSIFLGNGDGTFNPRTDFPTGREPNSVVTGDFNQDGRLDLAIVNSGDDTVSILLGNGDGTFMPRTNAVTGPTPFSAIAKDFDSDGKLDLAVTNLADGSVSILLGQGDGTFAPRVSYAAGAGAAGIVADDFNNDGKLDLAIANSRTPVTFRDNGLVSILLGNGDGTFQAHADSNTGSLKPLDLISGDFNGDGSPDLAVSTTLGPSGFGSASILTGNGQGMFQLTTSYGSGRFSRPIAGADFNLDGNLDVVVVNSGSNTMTMWKGRGDGTFQSQSHYGTGAEPAGVAAGDFNGDGAPDLAVINQRSNTLSLFLSGIPPAG